MPGSLFPNPGFAWVFYAALILILAIATYFDLRYLSIPKSLTVTTLVLGFLANLLRGAFLGIQNDYGPTASFLHNACLWMGVEVDDTVLGCLNGALFALGGFLTGFGIFFSLWILGTCGGGDVKLFAAVATWIGMEYSFWLWIGSILILILVHMSRLVYHALTAGVSSARKFSRKNAAVAKSGIKKSKVKFLPLSLNLAIAAVIMLLWFFRYDLQLVEPQAVPNARNAMTSLVP